MSNNWRPENSQGQGNEVSPRAGNLLREYHQRQNQQNQPPPLPQQQQALYQNQYSPVRNNHQAQVPPQGQYVPQTPPGNQGQSQQWASNAMQMVRRWSGKIAAQHAQRYGQPEPPMVLRHTPQTPLPVATHPKLRRWKRSRTIRIAMQMRHRRERWQVQGPNGGRIGVGILIAVLALLIIITSSTSAYAYSYYQSQLPHVQSLASQQVEQTTRIYDRNGVLLGDLFDPNGVGRRTTIQYKDLPQVMKDAMIAAEDKTFWTNSGVDPLAILRTATGNFQAQGVQGGASTLTQQLIKNLTHDSQQTTNRKLTEATLAIGLTQQYPKWKIMEMYFNVSPFGTLDLGVEAAAEEYFHLQRTCDMTFRCTPGISRLEYNQNGKLDPVLGLARAALLAGMPQSPVSYDPTNGKNARKRALLRQDEVLQNMLKAGMSVDGQPITETMIKKAEALTAKMTFTRYTQHVKAPHFFNWVTQQLAVKLGKGDENAGLIALYTGGFNIRTTIDVNLENYVEKSIDRHLNQLEYQPFPFPSHYGIVSRDNNVHNSAAVVLNARTGEILAMDGSADYNATADKAIDGQFNAATDALRSPGSTWKPIVYTTAFEMGMYPGIVLPDFKTYFSNNGTSNIVGDGVYIPPDYGGGYSNTNSSIRVATANSRNVPAVKAAEFAGIDNVANTARRFGITDLDKDIAIYNREPNHVHATKVSQITGLSFGLGTEGVSLLQMTGAYQVFANQGVRVPPQSILDIWDNYGHDLYHYNSAHPPAIRVISPQIAYLMTTVLADEPARAPEFLDDHVLSFNDWDPTYQVHQVAAKTGTTDQFVDNWTIGYTSNVVVGVWSGNSDNSPLINSVGITGAAPIWHSIIERVSGKPCDPNSPTYDGVPCGSFNAAAYNFIPGVFPAPPGIHQAATSSSDGLRGGGNVDWMLDGEDPTLYGISSAITKPKDGGNNGGGGGNNGPGGGTGVPNVPAN